MKKNVEDYMNLPYTVELTPDENSFFVKVKELDGCMTVGNSAQDALEMLDDAKREWLTAALEEGVDIPLPQTMKGEKFSGRFALRMPKSLHQKLTEEAGEEGVSLNQYIVTLLAEKNALASLGRQGKEKLFLPENSLGDMGDWGLKDKAKTCKVLPFDQRKMVEK